MPNVPIKTFLNLATIIAVKHPWVNQWWYKPVLRIVEGIYATGDHGEDVYFGTFTVTNIGMRPVWIKTAYLETGHEEQGGTKYFKPPIREFPKYGISCKKLPCKLKPDMLLTFYFEASELVTLAREYGKDGHLAGFHFVCQDTRGNSFTSQGWSFYEAVNRAAHRSVPGYGYITPKAYDAMDHKQTRWPRLRRLRRRLIGI